jgi:spermidine/putrescine transport system permease protein
MRTSLRSTGRGTRLKVVLLLSPIFIFLIVFFALPFVITIAYSIGQVDNFNRLTGVTLNFRYYVAALSATPLSIIAKSLWIAALTTIFCLVMGYPVAYWIGAKAGRWKNLAVLLLIIPFWSSFLIRTYAMMSLLTRGGVVNTLLIQLHLIPAPLDLLYNQFSVMLGMVYNYLPYMILPLYASTERLDLSLVEAAQSLGANRLQSFLRISLPLTMPGIIAGSILVFVPAVGEFVIPQLLGGTGVFLVGQLIWNQFQSSVGSWSFGSSISIIVVVLVLALLMLYVKYAARGQEMTI